MRRAIHVLGTLSLSIFFTNKVQSILLSCQLWKPPCNGSQFTQNHQIIILTLNLPTAKLSLPQDNSALSLFTHADDSLGVGRVFGCVCVYVCVFVCLHCREKTTGGIDLKLDLMLVHDDPKTPIDFGGQRSRSQGQKRSKFYFCHFSLYYKS